MGFPTLQVSIPVPGIWEQELHLLSRLGVVLSCDVGCWGGGMVAFSGSACEAAAPCVMDLPTCGCTTPAECDTGLGRGLWHCPGQQNRRG